MTGRSGVFAARWELQILPAFLTTLWRPADPHAIASLLSVASSLIPSALSRALIHALSEHPGIGGSEWTKAREHIAKAIDPETAEFYQRLFAGELFHPVDGVPPAVLEERLSWLSGSSDSTPSSAGAYPRDRDSSRTGAEREILRGLGDRPGGHPDYR